MTANEGTPTLQEWTERYEQWTGKDLGFSRVAAGLFLLVGAGLVLAEHWRWAYVAVAAAPVFICLARLIESSVHRWTALKRADLEQPIRPRPRELGWVALGIGVAAGMVVLGWPEFWIGFDPWFFFGLALLITAAAFAVGLPIVGEDTSWAAVLLAGAGGASLLSEAGVLGAAVVSGSGLLLLSTGARVARDYRRTRKGFVAAWSEALRRSPPQRDLVRVAYDTRSLATLSAHARGVGDVIVGLWMLAAAGFNELFGASVGLPMLLGTLLVYLAVLAPARRYYQRTGLVAADPGKLISKMRRIGLPLAIVVLLFQASFAAMMLHGATRWICMGLLITPAALLPWVANGNLDAFMVIPLSQIPFTVVRDPGVNTMTWVVLGISLAAFGLFGHVRFQQLSAKLRGPPPGEAAST
ncbi:MAG: hypothetical protein QM767_28700 [Anaeromyxobacter sp.]